MPLANEWCQGCHVFAEYGAIGHLKADTLFTVNLELLASSEKVTRVASVQVLVATE